MKTITCERITEPLRNRRPIEKAHMKYVDDLSLLRAVNLRETMEKSALQERPHTLHNRTEHILPDNANKLQEDLN